jgi:DNA-binding response OmpR family regulator
MGSETKLNDFYSNVIHEFRTPLSLIISPAEQIMREGTDPVAKEHAHLIHRNASKLLKLINEMLDISKIENQKVGLTSDTGDIVLFVYQTLEAFSPYGTHKNISLHFYSAVPELNAVFDKEKLEKVLYNIISNATKFTNPGGNVTVKMNVLENNFVQIKVNDTGIGITKEKLPHIFDRFFQGDTSRFVDQDGTGIGLSYCKELVQLMKGNISAKSVVDLGSEFTIEIPVELVNPNLKFEEFSRVIPTIARATKKEKIIPSGLEETETKPLLLIIDDSEDVRNYLKGFFEKTFFVETAFDGMDGYEKSISIVPDIVVSDILMPRLDGFELCLQLKQDMRTSHIPVVLLTSRSTAESRIEGFENGADDYLAKPFNVYELSVRLSSLIENRKRLNKFYSDNKIAKPKAKYSEREMKFIQKLRNFIEANMSNENLSVEDLSDEASMSSSQLNRKLKALLNLSPNQFIRKHRLHRAKEMLEKRAGNISEIAYLVGFNSPAYFTKCFSEEFNIVPSDV